MLVLTCRCKAQVVQRVPRGFGFEAWRQLYEESEARPPAKSQGMCQALLSPAKSDSRWRWSVSKRVDRRSVRNSWVTKCRTYSQEDQWLGIFPTRKRLTPSELDVQDVWKHGSHRPGIVW